MESTKNVSVLIFSVDHYDRYDLDKMFPKEMVELVNKEMDATKCDVLDLEDFQNQCNDQDIDLNGWWIYFVDNNEVDIRPPYISTTEKDKVEKSFTNFCDAERNYKKMVVDALAKCGERPLENGYGEKEPLRLLVVDDNGTGVNEFELDKARFNADKNAVEFHLVSSNGFDTDEWTPSYMLGSESTYAMENIIWE